MFHPQAVQRQQHRAQRRVFGLKGGQEPYPHHVEASQLSVHAWHELEPPPPQQGQPQQPQQQQEGEEEPPLPLYSGSRSFDLFYSEHLQVSESNHAPKVCRRHSHHHNAHTKHDRTSTRYS